MHLSFSAVKDFSFCPHFYKLSRVDKLKPFTGNIYTAFGTAIHSTCEEMLLKDFDIKHENYFYRQFYIELNKLDKEVLEDYDDVTVEQFVEQGNKILKGIPEFMRETFGNYKVISTEQQLRCKIPLTEQTIYEYDFLGFVDCIIKTEDGKNHIIDWKTCSWGWDARRKSDTMTTYQLSYYKHFYSEMSGLSFDDLETHFVLLKRTAKQNNIELVKVGNGKKKVDNALKVLENTAYNVDSGNFVKNKLSCSKCDFHKTIHCP